MDLYNLLTIFPKVPFLPEVMHSNINESELSGQCLIFKVLLTYPYKVYPRQQEKSDA
jgi:hypothetical protein